MGELAAGLAKALPQLSAKDEGHERILAVQLARTHIDFVPLIIAASRVGLPFVLLSTDLPDKALERQRAEVAFHVLRPQVCITDTAAGASIVEGALIAAGGAGHCKILDVQDLRSSVESIALQSSSDRMCNVLCFMFTGGTQRTKVVEATHEMVLHERIAYGDLWQPKPPARGVVLA